MNTKIKPLLWRTFPDGHLALGVGGQFKIEDSGQAFLLWDSVDEFSWSEHESVADAKAAAWLLHNKHMLLLIK